MPCCGNVLCPFCRITIKKELLEAHVAECPANPKNEVIEMVKARYNCTKCKRTHEEDSKIGIKHQSYKEILIEEEPVSIEPESPIEEPPKAEGGIGGLRFGGPATGSPPIPPKKEIPVLQKETRTFETLDITQGYPDLCKYIYWARDSCAACQGHRCAAAGDKKLAPDLVEDICRTSNHLECPYFTKAIETGVAAICPYRGPPPPEKAAGCTGGYCYADMRVIRVPKTCVKFWINCDTFARKKWAGVPFYRDLPQVRPEEAVE